MTFNAKKSARAGLRNVCAGLGLCLITALPAAAWHIILRCTPDIAYARILEPNTNTWIIEYIENGGSQWTWCASWTTGTTEAVFYKNPNSMIFRARKVD